MRGIEAELESRGADLTLIGSGKARDVEIFQEEIGNACRILSDPSLATFRAAGLQRGVGKVLSLGSMIGGIRAHRRGHRQTAVRGDLWQQGGAVVVAPNGPVLLHHVSQAVGDHVANEILLQAVAG